MKNMQKQIILITGCSRGLGFATVIKLINAGYIVYAGMRNLDSSTELQKACSFSTDLHIKKIDLADPTSINSFAKTVLAEQDRIDGIIHNAASVLLGAVDSATPEEVEYIFRVNVFGILRLSQILIPIMRKQNSGRIITIGSISGIESSAFLGVYAATKFALEAIVSSWATSLYKWNIKVSIIEPGAMNTNLPNTVLIGSHYDLSFEDPYKKLHNQSKAFLKECLEQGKHPSEVADTIINILKDPNPNLRYQTCNFSEMLVNKHLKDPTGNNWVKEHREFVDPWL